VEHPERATGIDGDHPQGRGEHGRALTIQGEVSWKYRSRRTKLYGRGTRRIPVAARPDAELGQQLGDANDDAGLAGTVPLQQRLDLGALLGTVAGVGGRGGANPGRCLLDRRSHEASIPYPEHSRQR
jgi:hypothetical protein